MNVDWLRPEWIAQALQEKLDVSELSDRRIPPPPTAESMMREHG
jgi:hypothetical protein